MLWLKAACHNYWASQFILSKKTEQQIFCQRGSTTEERTVSLELGRKTRRCSHYLPGRNQQAETLREPVPGVYWKMVQAFWGLWRGKQSPPPSSDLSGRLEEVPLGFKPPQERATILGQAKTLSLTSGLLEWQLFYHIYLLENFPRTQPAFRK